MKRNELEEKRHNLEYFSNFIEVSKIKIIHEIERENANLRVIQEIKYTNNTLLSKIGDRWLKRYNDYYEERKNLPTFYILVSPEREDEFGRTAMRKLHEQIQKEITPDDFVATVGERVRNDIRLMDLQVVEMFSVESFQDTAHFAERIGSLIDLGLTNNVFGRVKMIFAENDIKSHGLIEKTLYPFNKKDLEDSQADQVDLDGRPISREERLARGGEENSWASDYIKIINGIDLKKTTWTPDIAAFYALFAKAMIKNIIFELRIERNIAALRVELRVLEEKQKNLDEMLDEVRRLANNVRKEETTLQSLLLYSAFSTKKKQTEEVSDFDKYKRFAKAWEKERGV